jgi:tetratricopeptide (TPR) repeat protein
MNRAYNLMNQGDEHMTEGNIQKAVEAYGAAEALVPDSHEMVFWHAVTLAGAGRVEQALPLFDKAFAMWPKWRELIPRLPASGLLPDDPDLLAEILAID